MSKLTALKTHATRTVYAITPQRRTGVHAMKGFQCMDLHVLQVASTTPMLAQLEPPATPLKDVCAK